MAPRSYAAALSRRARQMSSCRADRGHATEGMVHEDGQHVAQQHRLAAGVGENDG
jgi:hypothetical protein